jgi:transposase, IS30 family
MRRRFWQLKLEEREQIMTLRSQGKSLREIAKEMERDHTTISREVRRNDRAKRYWACIAQRDAEKRKRKAGRRDRLKKEAVRNYVHAKLVSGWSPEQIEGRISQDQPGSSIGHEAIYQYVYCDVKELIPYLPH